VPGQPCLFEAAGAMTLQNVRDRSGRMFKGDDLI
jgi:hypothetical protein